MLSPSVTHPTVIITHARGYSNIVHIAKVALKKNLDTFKTPSSVQLLENTAKFTKDHTVLLLVLSIP